MIALLTDFHTSDGLGLVKGVMKATSPKAEIVDLHNFVAPFQVRSGAWILLQDYKYFPKGTVFYCVVDPGVGGGRRAVAVKTRNYHFVGPDNGLIYPAASDDTILKAVELAIPQDASKTFHGRDVFAPAAAKLDKGAKIEALGSEMRQLQPLNISVSNGKGEVVVIEHYGNIVTNIERKENKSSYSVSCSSFKKNLKFHPTYSEAGDRELFVIEGSRKTLELAVRQGSAAAILKCRVGDKISIM